MAGAAPLRLAGSAVAGEGAATREPRLVRWLLIGFSIAFLTVLLVLPLAVVLAHAFGEGVELWLTALRDPEAMAAIRLTLLTAAIVVPVNTAFGLCAAWALGKFAFRGRQLLVTLIDLVGGRLRRRFVDPAGLG